MAKRKKSTVKAGKRIKMKNGRMYTVTAKVLKARAARRQRLIKLAHKLEREGLTS